MQRPKVLVVNRGNHNYHTAEDFGELVFLTEGKINIYKTDNLKAEIESSLKVATAEDYLLASGHIIPNAIAIHLLLEKFGTCKILAWIGNKGKYQAITI